MSEEIGTVLPPPLRFELGTHAGQSKALLLLTTDADMMPRVAILAASEVAVKAASRLTFDLAADSNACANLQRNAKAALWSVLDAAAYCIRGDAEAVSRHPQRVRFEFVVSSVLRDFRPDAPLVCGPLFKRPPA